MIVFIYMAIVLSLVILERSWHVINILIFKSKLKSLI